MSGEPLVKFSSGWYYDEVRDGYYVDAMRKSCWAAQMEVFRRVKEICDRYGWRIFADCGTLLGAVRHGGFIPWDDDMDVCMFRDEFMQLKSVIRRELPEGYRAYDYHDGEDYGYILRVSNTDWLIHMDDEWLKRYHNFPFHAGIDIFPLDFLSPDPKEEDMRKTLANAVFGFLDGPDIHGAPTEKIKADLAELEAVCGITFDFSAPLWGQLMQLSENLFCLFDRKEAKEVALITYWIKCNDHRYDIHLFDEVVQLPFEEGTISAPGRYDEVLKIEYGDYMRVIHGGGTHNFPYYNQYERMVEQQLLQTLPWHFLVTDEVRSRITSRNGNTDRGHEPGIKRKRTVVFIVTHPTRWAMFEAAWQMEKEKEDTSVYLLPIPWFDKTPLGAAAGMHFTTEGYPPSAVLLNYETTDLLAMHPDVIYLQSPYDAFNYAASVHPAYFSHLLRECTECLIYIPWFETDPIVQGDGRGEESLKHYACMPTVLYADEVWLSSEDLRQTYIRALTRFIGEDTLGVWNDRIKVCAKPDSDMDILKELRSDWFETLLESKRKSGKIVLYYNALCTMLQHGERMIEKLREVFQVFREQEDNVMLLWCPDALIKEELPRLRPRLWEEYSKIVDEFRNESFGIYDDSGDVRRAVLLADAGYGDPGVWVEPLRRAGKPVMLEDCSVSSL